MWDLGGIGVLGGGRHCVRVRVRVLGMGVMRLLGEGKGEAFTSSFSPSSGLSSGHGGREGGGIRVLWILGWGI